MLSTTEIQSDLDRWWLGASDYVERLERDSSSGLRSRCYRFGNGYLEIESNCRSVLDILEDVYGDCSVARAPEKAGVRLGCSVLSISDSPLSLLSFRRGAPPRVVERALSFLDYQHLGSEQEYVEVPSASAGWRLIARADLAPRPMLAASSSHVLVDRSLEPWRFTVNYLVSTVMCLQRDVAFVHAGSAGVRGKGVLLAGPSRAGKTTLSLALAARGHTFFGENVAAICRSTRTLLPFRRTGYVRSGPRARGVDDFLKGLAREPEPVRLPSLGVEPRIPLRGSELFPASASASEPLPLGAGYFLRGFADRPAVEPFMPSLADVEKTLKPLTFDYMVATSWGATPGVWLLKYLSLIELFSTIPCYYLDVGPPDETANLIENTTEDSWVSR
jgi:hypothetical protein